MSNKIPHFACSCEHCAEEISYPADMLRVYRNNLYCEACWENEYAFIDSNPPEEWGDLDLFVPEADIKIKKLQEELAVVKDANKDIAAQNEKLKSFVSRMKLKGFDDENQTV